MNKKTVLGALALVMVFMSCEKYDSESDFRVALYGGKTVRITNYIGAKQTVNIPPRIQGKPVSIIGQEAFAGKEIISVTIPKSVTDIEKRAFASSSLTSITLPANIHNIGGFAFVECTSLTSITIPAGVTEIGERMFGNCTSLVSVTFAEGSQLQKIGSYAFEDCTSLTSITIPAGVTEIHYGAFSGCTSLTSITVNENNPNYISENGILYNKTKTELIVASKGISGAVTIPSNVTRINSNAFSGCTSITNITIPASVTRIGGYAFENCTSITEMNIPASVTKLDDGVFYGWTASQTINIQGHASQRSADRTWNGFMPAFFWQTGCNAKIVYQGGN